MQFSFLAAPFEQLCYLHCATLPELLGCRCSRLFEYQHAEAVPAEPSRQPSTRGASSSSCVETCASLFDPAQLFFDQDGFDFCDGIITPSRFDVVRQPRAVFASRCVPLWNLLAGVSLDESSERHFRTRVVSVHDEPQSLRSFPCKGLGRILLCVSDDHGFLVPTTSN